MLLLLPLVGWQYIHFPCQQETARKLWLYLDSKAARHQEGIPTSASSSLRRPQAHTSIPSYMASE
jgi:hypothetical protein